jgi:hypothetical protein
VVQYWVSNKKLDKRRANAIGDNEEGGDEKKRYYI